MRIDDGEIRGRHEGGGSENGQRRNSKENPQRRTSPEVAARNSRDRAMHEKSRLQREGYIPGRRPAEPKGRKKDELPGGGMRRNPAGRPARGITDNSAKRRERAAVHDDGLFDDIRIDEDIVADTGMEDKILSRAMSEERPERRRPKELNTAKTIIDRNEYSSEKQAKKKTKMKKIIVFAVLEVITLCLIFGYGYFLRTWNRLKGPEFNKAAVENNNIDITKKQEMQGYWTFAVFGVDSRGKGVGKGYNSDVIMIVSINKDTGDINVCSVFRDTYLNISDSNRYAKINAAYAEGGPEQAVKALNKNLDLNIENYVTFNWKAVADSINILGGVDNIDISKAELYYINAYITETVKATGIGSVQLKSTGPQHLDGVQAVAYMRLRYMDNDFARTERQREVLKACFEKAKKADFAVLNNIIVVLADQVATNISASEMVSLAQGITKYNIAETGGFPWARGDANIPGKGACVIPTTLESNVKMLHELLYGDDDYEVSSALLGYSEKIKQDSNLYKEGTPIESVGTDGGYIPKPTSAAIRADDEDEDDEETTGSRKSYEYETDEDGNLIYPTDENGNLVYPTDEDGDIILPTDEDGKLIMPSTTASDRETRPTDLADDDAIETGNDAGSDIVGPDGDIMPTRPGQTRPGTNNPGAEGPGSLNPTNSDENSGPGSTTAPGSSAHPTISAHPGESRPTHVVDPTQSTTQGSNHGSTQSGNTQSPVSPGGSGQGSTTASPISPGLTGGPGSVQSVNPNAA